MINHYNTLEEIFYADLSEVPDPAIRLQMAKSAAEIAQEQYLTSGPKALMEMMVELGSVRPDLANEVVQYLDRHPGLPN